MESPKEVEVLLEGLDENNITSVLNKWNEITTVRKKLDELEDMLKSKVKVFMKEHKWDRYTDNDSKISVTITEQKKEKVDIEMLKQILNEGQLAQIISITTFEKMLILTPESRERLKNYVRKSKI
jgi:hypothetical protein